MVGQLNSGQKTYDLVVIGGGVCGAWAAYKAGKAGLKTLLIEQDKIGAGASGGFLGALMPHMPERWDGKKQFQFEALDDLPEEIKELEEITQHSCGYLRCGRVAPIMNETKRGQMLGHQPGTESFWLGKYKWNIKDKPPQDNWPIADKATHGVVFDTFSARISPRDLLASLKIAIERNENIELIEGHGVKQINFDSSQLATSSGVQISYGHLLIAAGVQTFDFIAPQLSVAIRALGKPIKGQAALLQADIDPNLPIMFDNGLYVIAHDGGKVAIGSTSELEFDAAHTTDHQIDALIEKARQWCPAIQHAPVLEKWAGLRPRAIGRDPIIDQMPNHENVIVSTSGFKITFGIAHKMADVALELIDNNIKTDVPDSFKIKTHLAKAKRAEAENY